MPLPPRLKVPEESEPVTTEQIFQELQDPAPEVAEDAEPSSEAVDHPIEPEHFKS